MAGLVVGLHGSIDYSAELYDLAGTTWIYWVLQDGLAILATFKTGGLVAGVGMQTATH
jgi:hypothetical protein